MGYRIESSRAARPGAAEAFAAAAGRLHREIQAPCTFFVMGQVAEENPDLLRRLRDDLGGLADFQQMTFSGAPLKTVCRQLRSGMQVTRGMSPDQCADETRMAADAVERAVGVRPVGLDDPLGSYRGLADRPDILEGLRAAGIRFTRTYTRNAQDWHPLTFEAQPMRYEAQGVPEIVEIPGQGWPTAIIRETIGSLDRARYIQHLRKDIDYVAMRELVWSVCQTDWSSVLDDPEMAATRETLEYARDRGLRIMTHAQLHAEICPAAEPAAPPAPTESAQEGSA